MRSFFASALALFPAVVLAATPSWDDPNQTLYVTSPACDFYQCHVAWAAGQKVNVNWLNAPSGNVKILLESTGNGPTYTVVGSVAGTQPAGSCQGNGHPCGAYNFVVPSTWQSGDYSIAVHSLSNGKVGYTDIVTIGGSSKPVSPVKSTKPKTKTHKTKKPKKTHAVTKKHKASKGKGKKSRRDLHDDEEATPVAEHKHKSSHKVSKSHKKTKTESHHKTKTASHHSKATGKGKHMPREEIVEDHKHKSHKASESHKKSKTASHHKSKTESHHKSKPTGKGKGHGKGKVHSA